MSYSPEMASGYGLSVADSPAAERAAFIRRVYGHLAGAILVFVALETLLLAIVPAELILTMVSGNLAWLVVLVMFMGASWIADRWAHSETSIGMQYLGLGLYVLAQAIIFLPLLYIATNFFPPNAHVIEKAGIMTLAVFGGLTAAVFFTKRDYSYIAPILSIGSMLALGFMLALMFFGGGSMMSLIFCFFMVALASGYIIYQTSVIMHHYRTDQHVGASLGLFASVALLFWYILQIVMASNRN